MKHLEETKWITAILVEINTSSLLAYLFQNKAMCRRESPTCGSETGEVLWEFTRKEVVLLQGEREFSQVCSLEPNIPCWGSAETPQDWQASACVADAFGVFGAI